MATTPARIRSLYRSMLRELPSRPLSSPSPVKQRIRASFSSDTISSSSSSSSEEELTNKLQKGEQYLQYAKAQRMYVTLLERYNPGMNMDEEDRVKLSARRVGMEMPEGKV